jgi:hypothetical protein
MTQGFLPWSPVVDPAGYGFMVQDDSNTTPRIVRLTALSQGSDAPHNLLGSCL